MSDYRVARGTEGDRHMNVRSRTVVALVALAAALGCGSNGSKQPRSCQQDSECPSGAYCLGGACVAGMLPEAHIAIVGTGRELVSHRLVQFDGTGSVDPNPQHRLTGFRWAVKRASSAACDPSPATGAENTLSTTFRCAGDYQVELTVQNSLGLESAPIAQAVSVSPSANPPAIDAQTPDLVLQHRCAGTPRVCEAQDAAGASAFQLSVAAHDVEDGQALSYRWEVEAPEGADRAAAAFEPDAATANPIVRIRSTGGRIAGAWTFRALVTDGDALTAPAEIRVTVEDELPTLGSELTVAAFDHTFGENVYRVHGLVKYAFADADGDAPQVAGAHVLESKPTGCQSTLTPVVKPGEVELTVDLSCVSPDELSPTVGGQLLGAGVERQLELTIGDGQGGEATATLPLLIGDTPPTFSALVVATDHATGGCLFPSGRCFTAAGALPAPLDPDGDPAELVAYQPRALDGHSAWSSDGLGGFTLQTDVGYQGSFRAADGRSPVGVVASVRDPWRSADVTLALSIPNRPPVASTFAASPVAAYDGAAYVAQGSVAAFTDPDGDPLSAPAAGNAACSGSLSPSGAGAVLSASCTSPFSWSSNATPTLLPFVSSPFALGVSASDPWERSATYGASVGAVAPPLPTLVSLSLPLPSRCVRVCPVGEPCDWQATVTCTTYTYAPAVRSPVPVQVTASASSGPSATFNCVGSSCAGAVTFSCATTSKLTVILYDGLNLPITQTVFLTADCP
jgi:hypothetical protein